MAKDNFAIVGLKLEKKLGHSAPAEYPKAQLQFSSKSRLGRKAVPSQWQPENFQLEMSVLQPNVPVAT
jgi:hypothetical protein